MLTTDQQQRIARKCTTALGQAIDSLPRLLEDSEPEAAAEIVADLIKSCLGQTLPEPDPAASLAEMVKLARQEAETAYENPTQDQ